MVRLAAHDPAWQHIANAVPYLGPTMIAMLAAAGAAAADPVAATRLILSAQPADYPEAAIAAGEKGDVPVTLHIDADGRLSCRVTGAAALTLLRRQSCLLVANRWTFALKRDGQGRPVPSDVELVVRWTLPSERRDQREDFGGAIPVSQGRWIIPQDYPLEALRVQGQGTVVIGFAIGADGRVGECAVEEAAKVKELGQTACAAVKMRGLLLPALGPGGSPRPTRARLVVRFILPQQ